MGFEHLLGNERLKQNLTASLSRGHISHFYLISGPEGSGKHTLARLLAAAILCKEPNRPCLACRSCKKVMDSAHPDFITVDDPEKKTVSVELVRNARADIYIQPNESDYKIYLFPRAQDMGLPGQNALLKVLEEPPEYGVFLLLTDNPEKLLPTVRSRCTELALTALSPETMLPRLRQEFPDLDSSALQAACTRSGGYLGQALTILQEGGQTSQQAQDFVAAFSARNPMALLQVLVPMERLKRDALLPELALWKQILCSALLSRSGMDAISPLAHSLSRSRSSRDLMQAIRQLDKAMEYTQGNVSPAAVCGYLEWALRT